jgi:zinc/manganese transport system ATP-binding protein
VMDRIVYVAAGRAAVGSSEEVLRTDVLSRLYGQHVDVLHVHGRVVIVAGESGEDTGSPDDVTSRPDPVYDSGVA